jgi:hypothetical protein
MKKICGNVGICTQCLKEYKILINNVPAEGKPFGGYFFVMVTQTYLKRGRLMKTISVLNKGEGRI